MPHQQSCTGTCIVLIARVNAMVSRPSVCLSVCLWRWSCTLGPWSYDFEFSK